MAFICCANQLTGFYMRATLALNGLTEIDYKITGNICESFDAEVFQVWYFSVKKRERFEAPKGHPATSISYKNLSTYWSTLTKSYSSSGLKPINI